MTKADRTRLDAIHRLPCCACGRQPVEAHHMVDKGYRKHSGGHQSTIPLCRYHHQGDQYPHPLPVDMRPEDVFGPSLATNKRAFVARYGTELELLAKVNEQLNERKRA